MDASEIINTIINSDDDFDWNESSAERFEDERMRYRIYYN